MKIRLLKGMPKTLADVRTMPVNDRHFQHAMLLSTHGNAAEQRYAKAWFAHAFKKLKPFDGGTSH